MAELSTLFGSILDGAITAVAKSEARHLFDQVQAIRKLNGREPGVEDLEQLYAQGYMPDFFAAAELHIEAHLAMSTTRERRSTVGGGVELGPIRVDGSLSNSVQQGTQTNLSVNCILKRQSRSSAIENTMSALSPTAGAVRPAPVPGGPNS